MNMAVYIEGDAGRSVPHEVLHTFDIQPAANQPGTEGVAQNVRGKQQKGQGAALLIATMDIEENAVKIHAMQGPGAIQPGK